MTAAAAVRLAPPPPAVLRVVNPLMRRLLKSPCAGVLPSAMAVLEFTGRRSGRSLSVPVGVHDLGDRRVVFTEAPWRRNFTGGRDVAVRRGPDRRECVGVLVEDAEAVTDALAEAVARFGARNLAILSPKGHRITRDDLKLLRRSMVRLEPQGPGG